MLATGSALDDHLELADSSTLIGLPYAGAVPCLLPMSLLASGAAVAEAGCECSII
jgi:hypothetical protein